MKTACPQMSSTPSSPRQTRIGTIAWSVIAVPLLIVRRLPFSLVMIGVVIVLANLTGSIHGGLDSGIRERWGYDLENIWHGHIWVLVSSEVLTGYPAHVQNTIGMLVIWLVPYEALMGSLRALAAYWASTLFATGAAALISLLLIHTIGWDRSPDLVTGADVGASVGAWGVAGALSAALFYRGWVGQVVGLVFPIAGLVYLGRILVERWGISDIAHPIGLVTGVAVGLLLAHRHVSPTRVTQHRPSGLLSEGATR